MIFEFRIKNKIAEKHNLIIIEDAAEAFGSAFKGNALGTLGEIGVYSFNGNKIITNTIFRTDY